MSIREEISIFRRVYSLEIKTSLTSTTTGTTRRPARRQAEGKASSKIKATAEPAGVIDMLAPPSPRCPRVYSLRGSWRPFLLSFNLTFPANGQPGVNSTALIATRQSPTDSVRTTEKEREKGRKKRMRGWDHPSAPCSSSTVPGKERRFSFLLRVFFDPPQHSFPRLHSLTRLLFRVTMGMLISGLRSRVLISRFGASAEFASLTYQDVLSS